MLLLCLRCAALLLPAAIQSSSPPSILQVGCSFTHHWGGPSKQVLLLELTLSWKDHMKEANEDKHLKFQELTQECRRRGWTAVSRGGGGGQRLCLQVFTLFSHQVHPSRCGHSFMVDQKVPEKGRHSTPASSLGCVCWGGSGPACSVYSNFSNSNTTESQIIVIKRFSVEWITQQDPSYPTS